MEEIARLTTGSVTCRARPTHAKNTDLMDLGVKVRQQKLAWQVKSSLKKKILPVIKARKKEKLQNQCEYHAPPEY